MVCVSALTAYGQTKATANEVDDYTKAKCDYILMEARRQDKNNSMESMAASYEIYKYCLKLNPKSGTARFNLAFLLADSMAVKNLKEAVELYPDNYWYNHLLVRYYYKMGKMDEAQKLLETMSVKFSDQTDILNMLIETYISKQDYPNLIKALNKLEVKEGKSEQLSIEKFRTYVQMKDDESAFKEMADLAKEYPNDLKYQTLIGDLYFDRDTEENRKKALEIYRSVEAKDSTDINMLLSFSNYYQKVGNDSLYQDYLFRLVTNPKLDRKVRLQLVGGLVYENLQPGGDSTMMLNMFDKILALPQEDVAMHELCARYMASAKMSKERLKPVLSQMLEIEPESEIARNQMLAYAIEENDTASIYSLCKAACDYGANDAVYYFYLGVTYYQQNNFNAALETFQNGLKHTDKDTTLELIVRLHTLSGDIYHQLGQVEKAYMEYDSCLIYRPDDPYVLNNYAYYLSLEKKNLEKAEIMSKRSNELDPNNPTNIDTYAWILFQQKKYKTAQTYISHAIELLGGSIDASSSTIIEHAGDIYYKCGDRETAMTYWNKALELGNNDDLKALERKIKRRKI